MSKIKISVEDESWESSILKEIQENKYTAIMPNTTAVLIKERKREVIYELIFDEIEDLDELEEIVEEEVDEEEIDETEEIIEEEEEILIREEITDKYFFEFDFELFRGWVLIGRFLIPENQFREILLKNEKEVRDLFNGTEKLEVYSLMRGTSTKDILFQKEVLGIKRPAPIRVTKQLEKEIRALPESERKTLGRIIEYDGQVQRADWSVMTVKKILFLSESSIYFTEEETKLSLRKLKELERKKIMKEVKKGNFKQVLKENPKKGCKLLDKIKHPIKQFQYEKKDTGFKIRTPYNYMELYNEGLRMQNCIGKLHLAAIAEGDETPLFLERKGVIVSHILLNGKTIEEVRMRKNRNPNKKIEDFVDEFGEQFGLYSIYRNQYGYKEEGFVNPFF